MKAGLKMVIALVAILGSVSQSFAADEKTAAQVTTCEESTDSALCLVIPSEARESAAVAPSKEAVAADAKQPSMLSAVDLSGGALSVENEALLALAMDPRDFAFKTPAQATTEKLTAQQRDIEMHLKTIAGSGDLSVISAGH